MNIAFFLTPKKDVVYMKENATMRQTMERMEYHRYSAIPIVGKDGGYVGTLTEGDLLWKIKNTPGLDFESASRVPISEIPRRVVNEPVHINCDMEDLLIIAAKQNFVPVVDDENRFIGIVKRSAIITYCYDKLYRVKTILKA